MDLFDRPGQRQRQKIIIALQMALAALKTIAPKMRFIETQALNLSAHRAIKQQYPLARGAAKGRRRELIGRKRRLDNRVEGTSHSANTVSYLVMT